MRSLAQSSGFKPCAPTAQRATPGRAATAGNQARLRELQRSRNVGEGAAPPQAEPPQSAPTVSAPTPAAEPDRIGDPPAAGECRLVSGPSYSTTKPQVVRAGGVKWAQFRMSAQFAGNAGCCEVRQYIQWNQAFAIRNGAPPHGGFDNTDRADTWIEDRDTARKRYGHRSGPFSAPAPGCQDQYLLNGKPDQAKGNVYCGGDAPEVDAAAVGAFQFQLKVIDTCSGAEKGASKIITVDWT